MKKTPFILFIFSAFTALFLFSVNSYAKSTNPTYQSFNDVDWRNPYEEAILDLKAKRIVQGYEAGVYLPNNKINRAEMLKILIEANFTPGQFDLYGDQNCFKDVPAGEWFTKYVCFGKKQGIVTGYSDETFKPDQSILLVEALKISLASFGLPYNASTDPWYKDIVDQAASYYAIPVDVSSFDYEITRGQMAHVVYTLLFDKERKILPSNLPAFDKPNESCTVTYDSLKSKKDLSKTCIAQLKVTTVGQSNVFPEETFKIPVPIYKKSLPYFGNKFIKNISGLEKLPFLEILSLTYNQIDDISFLDDLQTSSLKKLLLSSNNITDITPLGRFDTLRELDLDDNKIDNVAPLASLKDLENLSIGHNKIADLSPLSGLTSLVALFADDNNIRDISVLDNLKNLKTLILRQNKISDVSVVKKFSHLSDLLLSYNKIQDASSLKNLSNLSYLNLEHNLISDLSFLGELTKLTELKMSDNLVSDLNPIKNLTDLQIIDFSHNVLKTMEGFESLQKIDTLHISHNQISTLPSMENFQSINLLDFSYNLIPDFSTLDVLVGKNLATLIVSGNPASQEEIDRLEKQFSSLIIFVPEDNWFTLRVSPDDLEELDGKPIVLSKDYTCDGDNKSPHLELSNIPINTQFLSVTLEDLDHPTEKYFYHWLVWDVPRDSEKISSSELPEGSVELTNDLGKSVYSGPCPSESDGYHRYKFTVHALSLVPESFKQFDSGTTTEEFSSFLEGVRDVPYNEIISVETTVLYKRSQ